MAVGKSTVARLLAARFERGVHVEGDVFRRSMISEREESTPDASPEALEQFRLRYRLAAAAAGTDVDAGLTVVLEDVVAGPLLAQPSTLICSRPCHVVVPLPSPEMLAAREAGRRERGYTTWTIDGLYEQFASNTPRTGLWLDTSHQTPEDRAGDPRRRSAERRRRPDPRGGP
jgi:hypothetical protein